MKSEHFSFDFIYMPCFKVNFSDDLMEPTPDINKNIIPHIKNDYLLSHINKNIMDNEDLKNTNKNNQIKTNKKVNNDEFQKFLDENNPETEDVVNNNSVIFTNSFIQISLIRANLLRKIFARNTEILQKFYFSQWKKNISGNLILLNEKNSKSNFTSRTLQDDLNKISDEILNIDNSFIKNENNFDYLNRNRNVIQNCLLNDNENLRNDNCQIKDEYNYDDFMYNNYSNKTSNEIQNKSRSFKSTNSKEFGENKFNSEITSQNNNFNDYENRQNFQVNSHNIENYNNNNQKVDFKSMSMKNMEFIDPQNIAFEQNRNVYNNNYFSRAPSLNINKSINIDTNRSFDNNNNNNKNTSNNKISLFIRKLNRYCILKESKNILQIFFYLFNKALKKNIYQYSETNNQDSEILNKQYTQLKSEKENLLKTNENISNMINHLKNECGKLEQNLKEKAMIIFNKNDEIEANREQIDILTQKNDNYREQIELLNKKIDKLESKLNNTKLNIIEGNFKYIFISQFFCNLLFMKILNSLILN